MSCTITVTGATGNIGRVLSETLLQRGHKVRALGRDAGRLQPLSDKGAEPVVCSVEDAKALCDAYHGADAAFVMIPPDMAETDQLGRAEKISKSITAAVRESGLTHAVVLSSIGAHLEKGAGIVDTLRILERDVATLDGVNIHVLRATYFMENLWPQLDIIKNFGFTGGPVAPDARFPVVATGDIAAMAADRLEKRDFIGHSMEYVLGPRDISYAEITSELGQALGRQLNYVQVPESDARAALVHMGMSANFVDLILEMSRSFNEGIMQNHHTRTSANTTPTDIRDFAKHFAETYKAGA